MSASGKSSNRMYDERRWGYEQERNTHYLRPPMPVAYQPPKPLHEAFFGIVKTIVKEIALMKSNWLR